jgi:hypothetical protein
MVKDVFFDYDKSDLRPMRNRHWKHGCAADHRRAGAFRLKATCDDRGSTEYNLALG